MGTELTTITESELLEVMQNSLYPGAKLASIKMAISYCRAAALDPLQKPVHIVPMNVKKPGSNDYEWRDVIMPGIGLYRTQAARTGQYGGCTEPEFGPDVVDTLDGVQVVYPQWCRITVERLLPGGIVAKFTAKELWLENYATAKRDTAAPNAMWKRRPYAQLAKCAEAQALRKGFPEIGQQPTADEMEGKFLDAEAVDAPTRREPAQPAALPNYTAEQFAANLPLWSGLVANGKKSVEQVLATVTTRYALTEDQRKAVEALVPITQASDAKVVE